jgi:catechol 2,3-dioxygenase-like lactoylglutathione lyase family enzyme
MSDIRPSSLDHVALWVSERDTLADLLCGPLGMHVIERTDDFTLVGADARQGKLTLFDAEGPRKRGVLERVVLRVSDLERALEALPAEIEVERRDGIALFDAPEGLRLGLVEAAGTKLEYDLDHVVLRVPDPDSTARGLAELGFEQRNGGLAIADRHVRLERADVREGDQPLLNHLAMLVDSVEEIRDVAEERTIEVDKVVDAANTLAVFLWGPDGIKLEYVEHKPGFSLV